MQTEEVTVQVDAGASTDAVRAKIERMKQFDYELVGAVPDLPANAKVPTEMKLIFRGPSSTQLMGGAGLMARVTGESILHSGPMEVRMPGANLNV